MSYEWSKNPGAYESQLRRKCYSYYFPVDQRHVSIEEIKQAKQQDISDYHSAKDNLAVLEERFALLASGNDFQSLNSLRQALDDLILLSLRVGGFGIELANTANELRKQVIEKIQNLYQGNSSALSAIDQAVKHHDDVVSRFYIPFIAQSSRDDGPIKPEDYLYSLLSESPKTIGFVMSKMSPEVKPQIRLMLLNVLNEAVERGEIESNLEEKVIVISEF